jgi:hypothetical protein
MTHWILQNNLYSEEGWTALTGALDRFEYPYSVHKCVPFAGTLEPEANPPPGPVIVMGSYTMARHAKERGWTPGAWLDNLDFEIQREYWGDLMLNADAQVLEFGTVPFQSEPFFMRPAQDTKSFTGMVFDWAEYTRWRDGIVRTGPEPDFGLETPIMICKKKEIWSETRTWVVDGKVVTASGYKVGTIKRYTAPEQVDARITDFAQACADKWSPNQAYVLDVAEIDTGGWKGGGLRIVEINNLNSAGFYKGDMQKLVQALNNIC